MKNSKIILSAVFCSILTMGVSAAKAQVKPEDTQMGMNISSHNKFTAADNELNVVYKKALATLSQNQKKLLVTSQRNWLIYRNSYAKVFEDIYAGGSMMGMVVGDTMTQLTNARTAELRNLINR